MLVIGTWAYALRSVDERGQHWVRLTLSAPSSDDAQVDPIEWQRFAAPESFKKLVAEIVEPGMTIVVTADSLRSSGTPAAVLESGLGGTTS